jgi:hypothetical protein
MTSALSIASWACLLIWDKITSCEKGSIPPVSTSMNSLPAHSQGA